MKEKLKELSVGGKKNKEALKFGRHLKFEQKNHEPEESELEFQQFFFLLFFF